MTNDEGNPNDEIGSRCFLPQRFVIRASSLIRHSTFVLRHFPSHPFRHFDAKQIQTSLQHPRGKIGQHQTRTAGRFL
jgi:hypothetical protein